MSIRFEIDSIKQLNVESTCAAQAVKIPLHSEHRRFLEELAVVFALDCATKATPETLLYHKGKLGVIRELLDLFQVQEQE